jgi:molybdate transport system substrate-binding protein
MIGQRICRGLLAGSFMAAACLTTAARAADYTIAAAISLKAPLESAKGTLEKAVGGTVDFTYGASGTLAKQVSSGAPIDLFLSADKATAEALVKRGDAADATPFIGNGIVVIVPAASTNQVSSLDDLKGAAFQRIALGEPRVVPAGTYAKESLEHAKLWDALKPKMVTAENVAQVLLFVARGEADAGFVYSSDAHGSKKVHIVCTVPTEMHSPVIYYMAAIPKSAHAALTPVVEDAIKGDAVQKALRDSGFVTLADAATKP